MLLAHVEGRVVACVDLRKLVRVVEAGDRCRGHPGKLHIEIGHPADNGLRGTLAQARRVASLVSTCDAALAVIARATTTSRLLPGEGDADVPAVLRALREGGSRAPLGVEVFSQQLIDLPAAEAARRAHDAVRSCLEKSR